MAWLIDICAEHADNRQAVFEEDSDGWLSAYFVDQGHLFGGPKGELKKNIHACSYLDTRIYCQLTSERSWDIQNALWAFQADKLLQSVKALPAEWKQTSAQEGLERCLQKITKPLFVQNILETIVDDIERRTATETEFRGCDRKPPGGVLCPRVSGSEFGQRFIYHPACA
jgi:hypothetical protein